LSYPQKRSARRIRLVTIGLVGILAGCGHCWHRSTDDQPAPRETAETGPGPRVEPAGESPTDPATVETSLENLTVVAYEHLAFDATTVDQILESASSTLSSDDDGAGSEDEACSMLLQRQGALATFDVLDLGALNHDAVLLERPENVKVVQSIGFCAGRPATYWGCARLDRRSMAVKWTKPEATVAPADLPFFGTLWLHEFGHTSGLLDLLPNEGTYQDVMYPSWLGTGSRLFLDGAACDAFGGAP
jgi:hypothetical protein